MSISVPAITAQRQAVDSREGCGAGCGWRGALALKVLSSRGETPGGYAQRRETCKRMCPISSVRHRRDAALQALSRARFSRIGASQISGGMV